MGMQKVALGVRITLYRSVSCIQRHQAVTLRQNGFFVFFFQSSSEIEDILSATRGVAVRSTDIIIGLGFLVLVAAYSFIAEIILQRFS